MNGTLYIHAVGDEVCESYGCFFIMGSAYAGKSAMVKYTGLYEHYGDHFLRDITNYEGGIDCLFVKEI